MNQDIKTQIKNVLTIYKENILIIEKSDLSVVVNSSKGIQISRDCLQQLRLIVRDNQFNSIQEEIDFFKEQKPFVYGRLKFFVKIHKSVLERPKTSVERQRKYINEQLDEIDRRRKSYLDFEKYYLQKENKLDKYYFVRGRDSYELISDTSHYYTDPEFSTSHDNMVARIIASELLINYFNSELNYLRRKELQPLKTSHTISPLENLSWTASKTDLVELIYALQASGAIQNGNVEIKLMATICEKMFSINLGNFYRTYLEIRERKMDRSRFLKHLKDSLDQKMENDDQQY